LRSLMLMNVGVPTWDGRVSPVLDVAKHLLVVHVEGGAEVERYVADIEGTQLAAKARRITELGVQVLVCGAVSWPLEAMLASAGVRVISQTCGPVDDVLGALLTGQLPSEAFLMPGCCGRRRRFRGGRRHGGRWGTMS
jgi:predicted Fe-Mo cluster-binding NifX family protein